MDELSRQEKEYNKEYMEKIDKSKKFNIKTNPMKEPDGTILEYSKYLDAEPIITGLPAGVSINEFGEIIRDEESKGKSR